MTASHSRITLAARVLLPIYLLVVAAVVFTPSDGSTTGLLDRLAELLGEPSYVLLEFTANIAMFVPFGVLVPLAFARPPWWITLALGFATTLTIELVQRAMPSRYSTVSDVIANTLGTGVGLVVIWAFSRRR